MEHCASCGHALDVGRFCTNCGHPVGAPAPGGSADPDWRTDTAERPLVAGVGRGYAHRVPDRRGRPWVPLLAGVVVLTVVVALGTWLLTSGDDGSASEPRAGASSPAPASTSPSDRPTPSPSKSPSSSPAGAPTDVARFATATVPATAPPNQDLSGNLVRYEATNLLDGVATTCWRMPGDGTGAELVFELAEPTTLTSVGLINGYAKHARDAQGHRLDWYHGNRRVLRVTWLFDDGTTVEQELSDTTKLQLVDVGPVTTTKVRLRLVEVSAPGTGRAARNYTPISDVSLVGSPA